MSKGRDLLQEKLNTVLGDNLSVTKRRELEKLMFDLYHQKQEANRQREESEENSRTQVKKIPDLERKLQEANLRIEQLEQTLHSRDCQKASLQSQVVAGEKVLEGYRKPYINLDNVDMKIIDHIAKSKDCAKKVKSLNLDMRKTLVAIACRCQDKRLLDIFQKLTEDQIMVFTHLGFSELHFLRGLTWDGERSPLGFIVNGVEYPPPKSLIRELYAKK
jgi:chromosome segregation ATPase